MRIAIVGAGLAGLSCAHELERLGYDCDIFDKRDRVGKMFNTIEIMLAPALQDSRRDVFDLIRQDLHLPLNPANHITRLVVHSQAHEALMKGHVGYSTIRGTDDRSLENQLSRHIRSPIRFDHNPDVEQLKAEYDWVVVATGSPKWPKHFGIWTRDVGWYVAGATVVGDFNPGELHFFLNTQYAGTGYGMICPYDARHAAVGVGVPGSSEAEVQAYWERFKRDLGHFWDRIAVAFHLECYEMGRVRQRVIDNIIFVGNAGGFIEPLAINGQGSSIESGVYAARKIALGDDMFDTFSQRWDRYYEHLWRLRLHVNAWTDKEMNRLTAVLGKRIGTVLVRSPANLLNMAGMLLQYVPAAKDHSFDAGPQ